MQLDDHWEPGKGVDGRVKPGHDGTWELFTAEGFDGVYARRAPAGVDGGEEGEGEGHQDDFGDLMPVQLRGELFEVVDGGIEERGACEFLHELADVFDIGAEDCAEDEADERAEDADRGAAHEKDAQNGA